MWTHRWGQVIPITYAHLGNSELGLSQSRNETRDISHLSTSAPTSLQTSPYHPYLGCHALNLFRRNLELTTAYIVYNEAQTCSRPEGHPAASRRLTRADLFVKPLYSDNRVPSPSHLAPMKRKTETCGPLVEDTAPLTYIAATSPGFDFLRHHDRTGSRYTHSGLTRGRAQ